MAVNSAVKARLIQEVDNIDIQLATLNAAFTESLSNAGTESYTLDTGQARQSKKNRDPDKILKTIRNLEILRQSLIDKLGCNDTVNLTMKRYG